jgi:hypothetical protein
MVDLGAKPLMSAVTEGESFTGDRRDSGGGHGELRVEGVPA